MCESFRLKGAKAPDALIVVAVLAIGCSRDRPPTGPEAAPATRSAVLPPLLGRPTTIRDDFLALQQEVPGFSGIFVDDAGRVVVRHVASATSPPPNVRERIARFARLHGLPEADGTSLILQPATRTYRERDSLLLTVSARMARETGVVAFGLDDRSDAIRVLVTDATTSTRISRELGRHPAGPFLFDVVGQPTPLQANLHARARPVVSGFQLRLGGTNRVNEYCSLGFATGLPSTDHPDFPDFQRGRYMLTASHCADPAQIDTFTAHQPAAV